MSKIICDVCGTSYAESATQCPICGCVRPSGAIPIDVENSSQESTERRNYTYVKGGRFSKANVKKRQMSVQSDPMDQDYPDNKSTPRKGKGDIGLIIAVCILLLAIVSVVIYIAFSFLIPYMRDAGNDTGIATTTESVAENITGSEDDVTTEITAETTEATEMTETIETTDETTVETTEDVADETTTPTVSNELYKAPFVLNTESRKNDVTIKIGETFVLKLLDANGKTVPVVWEIQKSDVCSADGNSIKGLAWGKSDVSTTYEGTTYTCIVRVDD